MRAGARGDGRGRRRWGRRAWNDLGVGGSDGGDGGWYARHKGGCKE